MANAKKLPSGNWRVRVFDYEDSEHKKHYKSFTAPTRKEALHKASEFSMNKNKPKTYENLTLSEAYQRYIDSKSAVLAPSTLNEYTRAKDRDFPDLMHIKLCNLTSEIIQTAVNEASAMYSPKTVRNKHGLLHSVLKAYCPSLVLNTHLPAKKKVDITVPTSDEIQILLDNACERLRVPLLLASSGSLRRSEICALTPEDVTDLGVTVNKAVVYDKNKKLVVKQPKTSAGYRFCPLPPNIVKEVKKWKHFGLTPNQLENLYVRLRDRLDIPRFKFHALRHYWASELHAKGIPDQYIAKVGGWSSVAMLHNIYQHTLRNEEKIYNVEIVNIFSKEFNIPKKRRNCK